MFSAISRALRQYAEHKGRGYPDWALRYLPLAARLKPYHGEPLLEIGANACGYTRFTGLPSIAVDMNWDSLKAAQSTDGVRFVRADIAALPFAQDTFSLTVCADTFEHLAEDARERAVQEIARVTAPHGAAAITFPAGAASLAAENELQAEYLTYSGQRLTWWEEHAENGLPDPEVIQAALSKSMCSHEVRKENINNLRVWKWVWRVLMCGWPGRGNALAQVVLLLLTPLLARIHGGTCYRAIIIAEPRNE